jgi:hypothetical protein
MKKLLILMICFSIIFVAMSLPALADPATPLKYEAEVATLSGGTVAAANQSNYSSTGFVAGYITVGAATIFTVGTERGGGEYVTLRYSNGSGSSKTLSIYVNKVKVKQTILAPTADWNTWGSQQEFLFLLPYGEPNTISYQYDSGDTANVILDYVSLDGHGTTIPSYAKYEAENATLTNGAKISVNSLTYSGTGFVDGYTSDNGSATALFTVNALHAGKTIVNLRYANGDVSLKSLAVKVNGEDQIGVTLYPTGSWNSWDNQSQELTLTVGSNTIAYTLYPEYDGNVSIDYISLAPMNGGRFEAEGPTTLIANGAVVSTNHEGFWGTGFISGFTSPNAKTTFTVYAEKSYEGSVIVRYANGTGSSKTLSLYLNGAKINKQINFVPTIDWNEWRYEGEGLLFAAGYNTITYQYDAADTGNVNLDEVNVFTSDVPIS